MAKGSSERSRQERAVNAIACAAASAAPPMTWDPSSPMTTPQLHSERIELHMASVSTPLGGWLWGGFRFQHSTGLSFCIDIAGVIT